MIRPNQHSWGYSGQRLALSVSRSLNSLIVFLWRCAQGCGRAPTRGPTTTRSRRPPPRNTGPWTRFEELRPALSGLANSGAILSARHHWQTGLWTVAAARRGAGGPTLDELRDALVHPRWPLYVGRKACALGLPPDPEIVEAPGPAEALNSYGWPWTRHPLLRDYLSQLAAASPGFELRYDLDYPGAPQTSLEVEVFDDPFHGGSDAQLIRGFRPRRVGIASTPVA